MRHIFPGHMPNSCLATGLLTSTASILKCLDQGHYMVEVQVNLIITLILGSIETDHVVSETKVK